jgi:LasA protease
MTPIKSADRCSKLILSIILLSFTAACNLPQIALRETATVAAVLQTAEAHIYPSQTPRGNPSHSQTPAPLPSPIPADPTMTPLITNTPQQPEPPAGMQVYLSQSGDTLSRIASRFGAGLQEIQYPKGYETDVLLPEGLPILVPQFKYHTPYQQPLLSDSEVVYGPGAQAFDTLAFAQAGGGYLNEYTETLFDGDYTGPQIVELVARETSTNPCLLIAFTEFRSGWVYSHPAGAEKQIYPLGLNTESTKGLYAELQVVARILAQGYYGWREGTLKRINFRDSSSVYIHPDLNAGSVALQYLFAHLYHPSQFEAALYGPAGFMARYAELFPDLREQAAETEPLFHENLTPPVLELPFQGGMDWAYTSGPHDTWQTGTPRGAVDFAPGDGTRGCNVSKNFATAAAPGLVVRSSRGVVAIDLDGDGDEGTGWVLIYMHMAAYQCVPEGTWLNVDDPVGHPSCEGGRSTGSHLHIARKYNGEWIGTGVPLPFVLGPWEVVAGPSNYQGWLRSGDQWVANNVNGIRDSRISRQPVRP